MVKLEGNPVMTADLPLCYDANINTKDGAGVLLKLATHAEARRLKQTQQDPKLHNAAQAQYAAKGHATLAMIF